MIDLKKVGIIALLTSLMGRGATFAMMNDMEDAKAGHMGHSIQTGK